MKKGRASGRAGLLLLHTAASGRAQARRPPPQRRAATLSSAPSLQRRAALAASPAAACCARRRAGGAGSGAVARCPHVDARALGGGRGGGGLARRRGRCPTRVGCAAAAAARRGCEPTRPLAGPHQKSMRRASASAEGSSYEQLRAPQIRLAVRGQAKRVRNYTAQTCAGIPMLGDIEPRNARSANLARSSVRARGACARASGARRPRFWINSGGFCNGRTCVPFVPGAPVTDPSPGPPQQMDPTWHVGEVRVRFRSVDDCLLAVFWLVGTGWRLAVDRGK